MLHNITLEVLDECSGAYVIEHKYTCLMPTLESMQP